ncbi:MAG TPA: DUF4013 domain-containing protein [Candidatus Dormibacteraeota bacterium]|nr:DUF4013 domain-containing protein [Candidatus Dormibacteraeota bacterium]
MQNAGDAFGSAFRDPEWFTKFLVMGLLTLIPIVGSVNLYGWALAIADYRRAGYQGLPPANLDYLGRGLDAFLVLVVYGLVFVAAFFVLFFALGIGTALSQAGSDPTGYRATFSGGAVGGVWALLSLVEVAFAFTLPLILLLTDHGGIGGGLNVARIVATYGRHGGPVLLAGLISLAGSLISGFGILACCIGIVVTAPYAYVVLGEMVYHLERALGLGPPRRRLSPQPPPPPPWPPQPPPWQPTPGV